LAGLPPLPTPTAPRHASGARAPAPTPVLHPLIVLLCTSSPPPAHPSLPLLLLTRCARLCSYTLLALVVFDVSPALVNPRAA